MNYVDHTDLEFQLIVSHGKGTPTKKLIEYFDLISRGMVKKLSNFHPDFKELNQDKYQESMLHLLMYWKRVKPCKTSFAYLSQMSKNASFQMYDQIVLGYKMDKALQQCGSKEKLPKMVRLSLEGPLEDRY